MQTTLSALVIHDLKNALALLEIDLEQLNHHRDVPPEGARAYRRCIELKNRLMGFLTLYKHEQSGLNPMVTEVYLSEFIDELLASSQTVNRPENHHGHAIVVQAAASLGSDVAYFDENLVELALESALNNALRYARHRVAVWFEQSDDALCFKVQDDGVGVGWVDELVQRNIAEQSSSTGLGLALCKAVAEAHGAGTVSLESLAEGGTLFTLKLPRPAAR